MPPDRATLREIAEVGGGQRFAADGRRELDAVYERAGLAELGTRKEKREMTAAFAGGRAGCSCSAAALMSLRWFGRLP